MRLRFETHTGGSPLEVATATENSRKSDSLKALEAEADGLITRLSVAAIGVVP